MLGIAGVAQTIGFVVSVTLFASGLAAALIATTKTRGLSETAQIMATGNAELRAMNDDLREQNEADKAECDRRLANMQGQIDALTGGLAERIVAAVITARGGGQ